MMGGVATVMAALAPQVRVVAVEPEGCPTLARSLEVGAPTEGPCETICDGVAVPYLTPEVFGVLEPLVDEVILISEAEVKKTMALLLHENHLVVEPSGALAVAAALRNPTGASVAVVTGGCVARPLLAELCGDSLGDPAS